MVNKTLTFEIEHHPSDPMKSIVNGAVLTARWCTFTSVSILGGYVCNMLHKFIAYALNSSRQHCSSKRHRYAVNIGSIEGDGAFVEGKARVM